VTSSEVAVRAAGGIVVRGKPPAVDIALVHRPSYDDWSLPKGKEEPGEESWRTALREVREETGVLCHIVGHAGVKRYEVPAGTKEVDYFLMRPHRITARTHTDEVDDLRWVPWVEASHLLTYELDRTLLTEVDLDTATTATTLHLIRHAAAGSRSRWEGPDDQRPLSAKGLREADDLANALAGVGVTRVLSSPYLRCVQTVEPLATALGTRVEPSPDLVEGSGPDAVTRLLEDVAGTTSILCSHGDVIPEALDQLLDQGVRFQDPPDQCRKGSTWCIVHDGAAFTEALYFPPPT
jgi:phosphohistidine phosphatase SixA/8-oxo-dGTP pyrophosphatase MutT (NUDIX family)